MPVSSLLNDISKALTDRPVAGRPLAKANQKADFGRALADSESRISQERHVEEKRSKDARPSSRHPAKHDHVPARDAERQPSESQEEARPKARPESRHDDARCPERRDDLRSKHADRSPDHEEVTDPSAPEAEISVDAKTTSQPSEAATAKSDTGTSAPQVAASETLAQNPVAELAALLQAQLNTPVATLTAQAETPVEAEIISLQEAAKPVESKTGDGEEIIGEGTVQDQLAASKAGTAAAVLLQTKLETPATKESAAKPTENDGLRAVSLDKAAKTASTETVKSDKAGTADAKDAKSFEQALNVQHAKSEKPQAQSVLTENANQTANEKIATQVTPDAASTGVKSTETVEQARPTTQTAALSRADTPVPLQAVAVEIGMRAMRGSKEFSIRLDPEDLGRIDIKLEISEAGEIQAKLTVDRVETLQMLQRDAKTLERAFDQAGLKSNPDGLQFSLRDPGQQREGQQGEQGSQRQQNRNSRDDLTVNDEITMKSFRYTSPATSGLDIRI